MVVSDGLVRNRLTVFFRLLLVIPHFIWLGLWSIAAFVAALANWLLTLLSGRPPASLHRFLSLYIKYATHVYGYLLLGASPYPPFDGRPGYPVDVEVDPPAAQPRATVAFRLILLLPALVIGGALFGAPQLGTRGTASTYSSGLGLAHAAAFLGWFVCIVRGRMPRGLRDAVTWGVGYAAQLWAYLLVLTSAYPDSDPAVVLGELPARDDPVSLSIADEDRRRSRLTVFFRLPLTFPHFVWLLLWLLLAVLAAIASWAATLVRGRPPAALHRFLSALVRYQTQVYAFFYLAANPFPGFTGAPGSYPLEAAVPPPERQNRWTVLFRLLLALPAWFVAAAYGSLLWLCALLGWFAALATGTMPRRLRNTQAHALRCIAQVSGYLFLITDAYPYLGPCRIAGLGETDLPMGARPSAPPHASAGGPASAFG
jgi:hypothetical protein